MADIATIWDPVNNRGDWSLPQTTYPFVLGPDGKPVIGADGRAIPSTSIGQLPGAGLAADQDLQTAVLISLMTDATAGADDIIPDGTEDPRGWWGDSSIGCKVWLRMRSKQTSQTLALVKADYQQALQWLIDDGVAAAVDVTTEWVQRGVLGAGITVRRADGTTVAVNFEQAWKDL